MAAAMCSVEPREPPPHFTLPGSFLSCATTSCMLVKGEWVGNTKTLYSVVRRASGVAWPRLTGGLPLMMPPSMTAPMTISARPVVSQPPPGLAGIIILRLAPARAAKGRVAPAASTAKDFKNSARRIAVSW